MKIKDDRICRVMKVKTGEKKEERSKRGRWSWVFSLCMG